MNDTNHALTELRTEVAQLRDLFTRRLLEDKARNSLYETLQQQAKNQQDQLQGRAFEALFLEALLAVDRLLDEPPTEDLARSVAAELHEVFARRGLSQVDATVFDARVHEVVDTCPAGPDQPVGTIAAVHRAGFMVGDRLLRPARVTVAIARPATEVRAVGGDQEYLLATNDRGK